MSNKLLRILLLSMLFLISVSNFASEFNQETQQINIIYSIGTGVSLNYNADSLGFMVDYFNIFHFQSHPFNKLLVKLGFGLNYNFNPIVDQMTANFSFTTSIGYLYIQYQYHSLSELQRFGAGFTVDYTMISATSHGLGITVYTVLNRFLLGLGGGAVFSSNSNAQPYIMSSFGFTY